MSVAAARPRLTPREYLARERQAEIKHEFVLGEIFAMSGASPAHNRICFNLAGRISPALAGGPCQGYSSDQRVAVPGSVLYTYPDITVVCGEPEFDEYDPDTLVNPTLIVEVLSPSTEAWDRGGKFAHYRRLPSLREYVLIAQDRPRVECYLRRGEEWILTEFSGMDAVLTLASVQSQVPLTEIYDRVNLPEFPAR